MSKIVTKPTDINSLTEDQKDLLLVFSTSRGQVKWSIAASFMGLLMGVSVLTGPIWLSSLGFDFPSDLSWVNSFKDLMNACAPWFAGLCALTSVPHFVRVPGQYKQMRLANSALTKQGIYVYLSDENIWAGLFAKYDKSL